MPHGTIKEIMPTPSAEVFRLLHDYGRRLEWDTMLQAAGLVGGHREAQLGDVAVCKGRTWLGNLTFETRYVSFRPPELAAVKLTNRPPLYDTFAATIRHQDLPGSQSSVEYIYTFEARPKWLRFALDPLLKLLFVHETRRRLRSLGRLLERETQGQPTAA